MMPTCSIWSAVHSKASDHAEPHMILFHIFNREARHFIYDKWSGVFLHLGRSSPQDSIGNKVLDRLLNR